MALASVQVNVRSRLPTAPAESADLSDDVAPVNVNELVDDPHVLEDVDVDVARLVGPAANADSDADAASSSSRRSGPRNRAGAGEDSSEAGGRDARGRRKRAASAPSGGTPQVVQLVEYGSAQLTRQVLAQLFTATGTHVLLAFALDYWCSLVFALIRI